MGDSGLRKQPPPLPNKPTVAQLRNHNEEGAKEGRVCYYSSNTTWWHIYQDSKSWNSKRGLGQAQGGVSRQWKNKEGADFELEERILSIKMKECKTIREFSDNFQRLLHKSDC